MNLLSPRHLVRKRRFLQTFKHLYKNSWVIDYYPTSYMSRQFDLLVGGVRDERVSDVAMSVWMAAGFQMDSKG